MNIDYQQIIRKITIYFLSTVNITLYGINKIQTFNRSIIIVFGHNQKLKATTHWLVRA